MLTQRVCVDRELVIITIRDVMQTLNTHEEQALHEVLKDITDSGSEREQNLAIDRYLKLNMAIALRNNTLSGEMFNKVSDSLKPKVKTYENVPNSR